MKRFEAAFYLALITLLAGLLFAEGKRNAALQSQVALSPKQLWNKLANSQVKLQIVDARAALDDYEDTHIPGALPFPGCDDAQVPAEAHDRIYPYLATVIVTEDGDDATYRKCAARFATVWNLQGGLTAWSDAALPEDSGEYVAPKASAGGGCL